jgi:IS5 family transposase
VVPAKKAKSPTTLRVESATSTKNATAGSGSLGAAHQVEILEMPQGSVDQGMALSLLLNPGRRPAGPQGKSLPPAGLSSPGPAPDSPNVLRTVALAKCSGSSTRDEEETPQMRLAAVGMKAVHLTWEPSCERPKQYISPSAADDARNTSSLQNKSPATSSLYRGVNRSHGKWHARIVIGGKRRSLGLFVDEEDAARAYAQAFAANKRRQRAVQACRM